MRKTAYPGYHDLYYSEKCHFNEHINENEISGHAVKTDGNRNGGKRCFRKSKSDGPLRILRIGMA